MLYGEYLVDRTLYLKALLVNAAYDMMNKQYTWPTDMGDKENYKELRKKWNQLSVSLQMSNKCFVDTIYQKIRSVFPLMEKPEDSYGYNGKIYDDVMIFNKMKDNIKENLTALAVCEKNRWNIEKLLFGYLPCSKKDDDDLQSYVENAEVKETYADKHTALKKEIKSRPTRMHPNICSYEHLNVIDPGAKDYDLQLSMHLPEILMLVDGHKKISWYIFRMKSAISAIECKENWLEVLKSDILAEINDVVQYLNSKEYLNHLTKNKRI